MKAEFRSAPHENVDVCCDYYRLTEFVSFDEVLAWYQQQRITEPEHQWLLTLDDLSLLPEQCFATGEHVGYIRYPAELIIRQANFRQRLANVHFEHVIERRIGFTTTSEVNFLTTNQQPLSVVDDEIWLIKVPVSKTAEALLGLPKGYFSSDLSPMESYRLAERLARDFGYRLLGVGASYLGFYQTRTLNSTDVAQLLALMQQIYSEISREQLQQVAQVVTQQPLLLLSYTE